MSNEEVEARLRQMREDAKTEESERSRRLEEDRALLQRGVEEGGARILIVVAVLRVDG